jgi:hypothetical protein
MRLAAANWAAARGTDAASIAKLRELRDTAVYHRADGVPLALFRSEWVAKRVESDHPELTLQQILFA